MNIRDFYENYRKINEIKSFLALLQNTADDIDLMKSFVEALDLRIQECEALGTEKAIERAQILRQISNVLQKRLDLEIFS